MTSTFKNKLIRRGLYLAYWPNGSFSVVNYKKSARMSDLFFDLDAFGNPYDAMVVFFCDEVAIDFYVTERRGRSVIEKTLSDRGNVKWIRFPSGIAEFGYLKTAGA